MANANESWHSHAVENDQNFVLKLVAFFKRTGRAISNAARWIFHAPSQLIRAIANGFKALWKFIKWLGVFALKIILIFIALTLIVWAIPHLVRLVRIAYEAYNDGRATRDLEAAPMRNRTRTQHQVPHSRHQDEQIFHSYQSEAEREVVSEERQRQNLDQAQGAEQERRAAEQERKRLKDEQEIQRRRTEDLKRYRRWKATYDVVFSTGIGALSEPPYWPCNEVDCQGRRHIKACYHSLRRLFNATENPQETLRCELRRWHPDWAIFQREGQRGNKEMAHKILQVILQLQNKGLNTTSP